VLSVALGLVTVWVALFVAFYSPYPIGFWLTTIAFGLYAVTRLARTVR
jgi:zinc/manganese transport system permease protein